LFFSFCGVTLWHKFNSLLKPTQILLLGGLGILAYSLIRKATAAGNLVFYPKGIRGLKFEGATPIIELGLGVGNASNQDFTINAMAGNLYTNDTYIGYVSNYNAITIPPRSEAVIPIKIRLSLIGIVSQLVEGISNGTWTQNLDLQLQANVDNLVQNVGIKYKVGK